MSIKSSREGWKNGGRKNAIDTRKRRTGMCTRNNQEVKLLDGEEKKMYIYCNRKGK